MRGCVCVSVCGGESAKAGLCDFVGSEMCVYGLFATPASRLALNSWCVCVCVRVCACVCCLLYTSDADDE